MASRKRKYLVYVSLLDVQTSFEVVADSLEDAIRVGRENTKRSLSGEWIDGDIEVTGVYEE